MNQNLHYMHAIKREREREREREIESESGKFRK
jgi:hypothetical protein